MPKKVSYTESTGGGFFSPSADGYPAIIVGVIELGTEMKTYKDQEPRPVEEIALAFEFEAEVEKYDSEKQELTGEKENRIGIVSQSYTPIVSDNSKLGKLIKAVYDVESVKDIKNFSLDKLLGLKCYVDVDLVGKEKNIPIIKSVSGLNKKFEAILHEQKRESFYFGMEDPEDYIEDWETLFKDVLKPWEIKRIKESKEYISLMKTFGIEVEVKSIEEEEKELEEEIEQNKKTMTQADAEAVFNAGEVLEEEPETVQKARDEAKKAEADPFDD